MICTTNIGGGIMPIYTAAEIATKYNISRRRVYALATSRSVGKQLSGVWVFSEKDIGKLEPGKTGRPKND